MKYANYLVHYQKTRSANTFFRYYFSVQILVLLFLPHITEYYTVRHSLPLIESRVPMQGMLLYKSVKLNKTNQNI